MIMFFLVTHMMSKHSLTTKKLLMLNLNQMKELIECLLFARVAINIVLVCYCVSSLYCYFLITLPF